MDQPTTVEEKTERQPASLISVIVPTRNEADNVQPLLDRLAAAMGELSFEVLFVDDSSDNTAAAITSQASRYAFPVRLLARPPEARNGLSGAVVDGMRAAQGEWLCVMDADLQHPPEVVPRLWSQAWRTGADMVVGSRKGDLFGPLGLSRARSLTSKALTVLARMVFPRVLKNVSDPLTGLFLVRRAAVDVDVLRPDGFKILLEILARCPGLHVSEIHFDFAARHDGESKADVREGMRFFRHLVRLRVTVNPHLVRFVIVFLSGLVGNTLLLAGLVAGLGLNYLPATVLAAELMMLWNVLWFEFWVFSERPAEDRRRRLFNHVLLTQVFLLLLHLPLAVLLVSQGWAGYLPANLAGIVLVSLVRYSLSEQWIWTRSSMVWQPRTFHYDIHGIVKLSSQVYLDELHHFAVDEPLDEVDVEIRLDRQGAPSPIPGGISYHEHMGRFGFGLTVVPASFTEVVVSPLLYSSPSFLFTNIVEPLLRWHLVRKGHAFAKAAAVAMGERAFLINADADMGQAAAYLCRTHGFRFLGDDLVIVDRQGRVYGYQKPVTPEQQMLPQRSWWQQHVALRAQRLLYSPLTRRLGLWLSARALPAATLNTYLQRFIPQPRVRMDEAVPGLHFAEQAQLSTAIAVRPPVEAANGPLTTEEMRALLQQPETAFAFQPHPLLAEELRHWQGRDLLAEEQQILTAALSTGVVRQLAQLRGAWWEEAIHLLGARAVDSSRATVTAERPNTTLHSLAGRQGEPKAS